MRLIIEKIFKFLERYSKNNKTLEIFLIGLILINFLYVLSGVFHYPLQSIDVYSIWLFKAKAFYLFGFPNSEFWRNYSYSHPHYPVLLPVVFSCIYKLFGSLNEIYVLIIYPFLYLLILYLFYKLFLRLNLSRQASLFFTYIY